MHFMTMLFASLALLSATFPASAQVPDNCTMTPVPDTSRYVLECAGGLVIELEAGTDLTYGDRADGLPRWIGLTKGRALISAAPGGAVPQIRTPQAIAAVRGTVYAVEALTESTAVFVLEGTVEVTRSDSVRDRVSLMAGQGVDVADGQPMEASLWSADRVRELLSRFGR